MKIMISQKFNLTFINPETDVNMFIVCPKNNPLWSVADGNKPGHKLIIHTWSESIIAQELTGGKYRGHAWLSVLVGLGQVGAGP